MSGREQLRRRVAAVALAAALLAALAAPAGAAAKKPRLVPVDGFRFEGNSGTRKLEFEVVLSRAADKPVSVDYSTSSGGAHPADAFSDYTDVTGTLTIKKHKTSGTISVPIQGDLFDEYAETLKLNLSHPQGARLGRATATGFILDDDPAPTVSIAGTTRLEGAGAGSEILQVNLSRASGKPISVYAQTVAGGSATPGTDYTATGPTRLDFAPGVAEQDFSVPVLGDARFEGDEAFAAILTNPSPTVSMGTSGAFGVITNDDPAPQLSIDDVSHPEGNTGTTDFTFTVTLTGATDLPASVDYTTTDGSATTADSDYAPASGTLNFAPGDTSKQVTVQVQGDTKVEPAESFTIDLAGATGATISDSSGTGQILNDD